jgi:protein-disulfide isomerase
MYQRHVWLFVLVIAALLVAACGPEMITPTAPTEAAIVVESTEVEEEGATVDPEPTADVQVDEDDWRVLGSADAPVTIVEYSDFQ